LKWYEFDPFWIQLGILKFLGVVRPLHTARLDGAIAGERPAA
jgi:fatty-acid desaturase